MDLTAYVHAKEIRTVSEYRDVPKVLSMCTVGTKRGYCSMFVIMKRKAAGDQTCKYCTAGAQQKDRNAVKQHESQSEGHVAFCAVL